MKHLHTLWDSIHTFISVADRGAIFDGVFMETMGDLAHTYHVARWKRSPAGTGKNCQFVELGLRADNLVLYAPSANRAIGKDGTIMATEVLRHIPYLDHVIILDVRFQTAAQLVKGTFEFATPSDPGGLEHYRNDAIRAAAYNDANRVSRDIPFPRFMAGLKAA